jgi:sirohydrochlorin ferrochelatase
VLPLFLLSGVHVMSDIPAELAIAQQTLAPMVSLRRTSHLGSHPGLARLVAERMAAIPVETWVLLAHGSRRPGANEAIAAFAHRLGATAAYWAAGSTLEEALRTLKSLGIKTVGIFPHFLFAGGITEAIAQTVNRLALQFPTMSLHLSTPLDVSPDLADLLVDLARQAMENEP